MDTVNKDRRMTMMDPNFLRNLRPLVLALLCLGTPLMSVEMHADVLRLSQPVESDAHSETFGAQIDNALPRFTLKGLLGNASANLDRDVLLETTVGKVCQKKGCFFLAIQDELAVRVSFKDYGFFVPTNTGGKTVTLAGQLIQRELSPAQAEHFNSDIQDGETTLAPGFVYEIVAEGVRIPR
ncbi:MAG: DUF4920 domain-containing protein [Pseudomonadota bacterium]